MDAFPEEEAVPQQDAPSGRIFELYDTDVIDRARADDDTVGVVALPPPALSSAVEPVHEGHSWTRVAFVALAFIAATGWGAFLYERTSLYPIPTEQASPPRVDTGPTAEPAAATQPTRVDSAAPIVSTDAAAAPVRPVADAAPTTRVTPPVPTATDSTASDKASPVARVAPVSPTTSGELAPLTRRAPADSAPVAPSFSGSWTLNVLERANGDAASTAYQLELKQNGHRISGRAWKVAGTGEDSQRADAPLPLEGTFDGKRLLLITFARRGGQPSVDGKFVLQPEEDGVLRGRFSMAGAGGMVEGRRR